MVDKVRLYEVTRTALEQTVTEPYCDRHFIEMLASEGDNVIRWKQLDDEPETDCRICDSDVDELWYDEDDDEDSEDDDE